jgi:hypothetical protein
MDYERLAFYIIQDVKRLDFELDAHKAVLQELEDFIISSGRATDSISLKIQDLKKKHGVNE